MPGMRLFQAHDRYRVSRVRFAPADGLGVVFRNSGHLVRCDVHSDGGTRVERRIPAGVTDFAFAPHDLGAAFGTDGGQVQFRSNSDDSASCTFDIGRTYELMEQIRPVSAVRFAATPDPRRCWLAMASSQFCLWNAYSQEYIFNPAEGDYRGAAFGPDGSVVASIEHHAHALTVWNVKPFHVLFRAELTGIGDFSNGAVAMLPDGNRIVFTAGDQLRCVSMTGGPGWETELKRPVLDLALHPGGGSVLIADGTKAVTQFDTSGGRPVRQFDWSVGKVSCVDISADGALAAAGGEKGRVVVWDVD